MLSQGATGDGAISFDLFAKDQKQGTTMFEMCAVLVEARTGQPPGSPQQCNVLLRGMLGGITD